MEKFDLFVRDVVTCVTALFGFAELCVSSKTSHSLITFTFGSSITQLSCFQTIKTICTNIGRRYGFVPEFHTLSAVNNSLVYAIKMG